LEVGHQPVVTLPRLDVRRQHVDVAVGEAELEERGRGDDEERNRRHQDHDRALHDPGRQGTPETTPAGAAAHERQTPAVHVRAENGEQRGKERERVEHRDGDDDRPGSAH